MKDADLLMSHFPSPCKHCSSLFGSLYLVLLFYALSFLYLTNEAYGTSLYIFSVLCPFDTLQNEAPLYIFSMLCPFDTLQIKRMVLHYIYAQFLCFVIFNPYK